MIADLVHWRCDVEEGAVDADGTPQSALYFVLICVLHPEVWCDD
jgi:hypothetical protein